MESARTRGASLATPKAWILISTLALLVSLTKKTGIYTVIIACILTMLVAAGRKVRLRLAGTVLASAIVMFLVLPGILFPLCHIVAGGKQEMIAVPLQQSALLLKKHGDELSQADRDVFEGIPRARCRQQVLLPCCRSDERHALDRATRTIVETVLACVAA